MKTSSSGRIKAGMVKSRSAKMYRNLGELGTLGTNPGFPCLQSFLLKAW